VARLLSPRELGLQVQVAHFFFAQEMLVPQEPLV
jgi:hypothetical protein